MVLSVVPPFDFAWNWHDGGAPFQMNADKDTGRIWLHARSEGDVRFTSVHAGFGLILRTDRPVTAEGASLRKMSFKWQTQAGGVNSFALSEGGMEFTALENGQLIASASDKLFRKRVSGGVFDAEEASDEVATFDVWKPLALNFQMNPGREYTFNVGIWITADRSNGLGGSSACQGLLDGNINAISIKRS